MNASAIVKVAAAATVALAGTLGGPASAATSAPWPYRLVVAQPARLGIYSQVIDHATGTDLALATVRLGQYRLRSTPIAGGRTVLGPAFPVPFLTLGAGALWIFGPEIRAGSVVRLYEVNPASLTVTRSWTLSPPQHQASVVAVAAGRDDTVWVGFLRTILRINARSGAVVGRIAIPDRRLLLTDLAPNLSGRHIFVSLTTRREGSSSIAEFSVATGRQIAFNAGSAVAASAGQDRLTAAPGRVWVSFRTGMMGETVLLRLHRLEVVRLPGAGSPGSLFEWAMWASTFYAGHSVYLARDDGRIACLYPRNGHDRVKGLVRGLIPTGAQLLGAADGGRVLYAASARGVIAITPPAACDP